VDDVGERIALGFAGAERQRRVNVEGAEALEIDGLLLAFANVPDAPVNATLVISEPSDAVAAIAAAEEAFRERGRSFGLDVAVGRHPSVDRAIRGAGLTLLFAWPGMAVRVDDLPALALPAGIRVEPVVDERGAAAIAHVEQVGFGSEQEIAERFYAAASYGGESARSFVAWDGDEPVGMAAAYLHAGAIGLFGVAVVPAARRRGIAAALSVISARAFPADLAWLHTSDEAARSVYERLGFREVAEWEVWVRSA
jgi:ribosomal protein S18 acetylase RimI-like enzyme